MSNQNVIANNLPMFKRDIGTMESLVAQLENLRTKVFDELAALNSMWEGPAHEGLIARFEADNEFTVEFLRFLQNLKVNYDEAHKAYSDCEAQVADTIGSMNLEVG